MSISSIAHNGGKTLYHKIKTLQGDKAIVTQIRLVQRLNKIYRKNKEFQQIIFFIIHVINNKKFYLFGH